MRTIVWGVSPRIFNRYWQDPVYELFQDSEGYIKDQLENEKGFSRAGMKAAVRLGFERTLSTISATVAHRSILKAVFLDALTGKDSGDHFKEERLIPVSDWGFMEFPEWQRVEMADPCEIGGILESLKSGRFKLDRDRLEQFCKLIGFLQERDIRLICFVPPMHHSLLRSGAADADGMPDADYVQLMNELQALESKFGNYRFVDFHKAGDNGFTDAEYGDYDHLNFEGSRRFSMTLAETIEQFSSDTTGPNDTSISNSTNTSSNDTNQGTTDTTVSDNNKPANGDGDVEGPEIESHLGEDDYMIGAFPPDNRPLIWAEYEDDESGIDIESVRMFMDGKDITADCRVREGKISFKPAKTLKAPKLYEFKVIVYDKAGNSTELVWEILLKRC
jgi:hypothetical protein